MKKIVLCIIVGVALVLILTMGHQAVQTLNDHVGKDQCWLVAEIHGKNGPKITENCLRAYPRFFTRSETDALIAAAERLSYAYQASEVTHGCIDTGVCTEYQFYIDYKIYDLFLDSVCIEDPQQSWCFSS